jgi:hypothetical protein
MARVCCKGQDYVIGLLAVHLGKHPDPRCTHVLSVLETCCVGCLHMNGPKDLFELDVVGLSLGFPIIRFDAM